MRIFVDDFLQVRYVNLYNSKVSDDIKCLVIGDVHISDNVSFKKIALLPYLSFSVNFSDILFSF